jgi:hypothetical protein
MTVSSGASNDNRPSGPRWLLVLLLVAVVLTGLALTNPAIEAAPATATPGAMIRQGTPQSTLPAYVGQDINQMTPIILGGAILVLIILAGTFSATRRHS